MREAARLPAGYSMQVDTVDQAAWHGVLDRFKDANIYQTWPYEALRAGPGSMSHLLLLRGDSVVAAAQARLVRLPWLRLGVAYVRWGPLWRLHDQAADGQTLACILACLRAEYATKRGLAVRVLPYLHDDAEGKPWREVLVAARYDLLAAESSQRTLLLSLEPPLAEIRARLDQKWRNGLNRGEKNRLVIEEGTSDGMFARFVAMHAEMRRRKGVSAMSDVSELRAAQRELPEAHKMRVFLASIQGCLAAGVVCSKLGDFGVFLHGATSDAGMQSKASYLLQWRTIEWLKERGAVSYNLHGINPELNPGTYHFKAGLCGRNGRDVRYLGTYQCRAGASASALIALASSARRMIRRGRAATRRIRVFA